MHARCRQCKVSVRACDMSQVACTQVFRTEIVSRRLNRSATLPLMSAALTTVAGIMAVAAVATHPKVRCFARLAAGIARGLNGL